MPRNSLQIVLDHGYGYAGSSLSGKVIVRIEKSEKARSIFLDVNGLAEVHFYQRTYYYRNEAEYVRYSSAAAYLNFRVTLWTPPDGNEGLITPGKYSFPFKFGIPLNCPPNFEGNNGQIRYTLKAEIDVPWAVNPKDERNFLVLTPPGTYSARIPQPIQTQQARNMGCCNSRVLTVGVNLPYSVYYMNERIPISLAIRNKTQDAITSIEVGIKSYATYTGVEEPRFFYSGGMVAVDTETIYSLAQEELCNISAGADVTHETYLCMNQAVFGILNCPFIRVDTTLYICLHRAGVFSTNFDLEIPITIIATDIAHIQPQLQGSQTKLSRKSTSSPPTNNADE